MSFSDLRTILEDYRVASNRLEKNSIVNMLISEVFKHGFDASALEYFSNQYDKNEKQEIIKEIFEELEQSDEIRKYEIIDTLSSFLVETTLLIQDQILPVYFKNLSDDLDFKLVFTTLKIFTAKWNDLNDDQKKLIYLEFLKVLDNRHDIFIEEGIFEITKILLDSKSSVNLSQDLFIDGDFENYIKKLVKIASKSKDEPLYAAFESIKQILDRKPSLITEDTYRQLFPLFKKVSKKIAVFYPAKRNFIKFSVSFGNLILIFANKFCDKIYVKNLKALIKKMTARIDHADIKYLLELLSFILDKTTMDNSSKVEVLRPSFEILRNLYHRRDRMDDYIISLIEDIINSLWPILNDEEKELFFQETDFGESVI